jgi:hypothetical protein
LDVLGVAMDLRQRDILFELTMSIVGGALLCFW